MEKYMLHDRAYGHLSNLDIPLTLIKFQIVFIAGVEHYTFGMFIRCAPVMNGFQQLLAIVQTLKLRVNSEQR